MAVGKRVEITGAAAGIGRAAADAFLAAGWFVGVYDIDDAAVQAWADMAGREHSCAGRLDVADMDQWQTALAEFEATAGGIDVLLNNAGILVDGAFEANPIAAQQRVIEVNVVGVMNGCHAARASLAATGGRVINMSSAAALFGQPYLATYSASKFAVRGLTESLHVEWAPSGVQVCDVGPLFVRTAMVEQISAVPALRRMGIHLTVDDVAQVILRAATAPRVKLHYTVGFRTALLKLLIKCSPDRIAAAVVGRLGR
jgi:NAD(P)-dependent dehydrogenase (short-subunit alcohol dehydrogenase family)